MISAVLASLAAEPWAWLAILVLLATAPEFWARH